MKVVLASDLHLDATMVGSWSSEYRVHSNWIESFGRLNDIVTVCNDEEADLLVVAGDIFHSGRPQAEAVARTVDAFYRLDKTKVVFVTGNHDQTAVVGDHRTPLDAYLATHPWCYHVASEPGIIEYDGFPLALSPWPRVAGASQAEIANNRLRDTVMDLADKSPGGGIFSGHIVVNECTFDSGRRSSEMIMSTGSLEASVATATLDEGPWLFSRLGHIHKRQSLSDKTGYIGSPYKVTFGEHKEDKGCEVIDFSDKNPTIRFVPFRGRDLAKIEVVEGIKVPRLDDMVTGSMKGDIFRFVVDGAMDDEIEQAIEELEGKGVLVQVHHLPQQRKYAIARGMNLQVDTPPRDALKIWLERQEYEGEQVKRLLSLYGELSES